MSRMPCLWVVVSEQRALLCQRHRCRDVCISIYHSLETGEAKATRLLSHQVFKDATVSLFVWAHASLFLLQDYSRGTFTCMQMFWIFQNLRFHLANLYPFLLSFTSIDLWCSDCTWFEHVFFNLWQRRGPIISYTLRTDWQRGKEANKYAVLFQNPGRSMPAAIAGQCRRLPILPWHSITITRMRSEMQS